MNILFSVPRLHTNYAAMIQGLVEDGHKVSFIAMDSGTVHVPSEYDIPVYQLRSRKRVYIPRNRAKQFHFESFSTLNRILKKEQPDLIITRDLMLMNSQLAMLGRIKGIPTLYYDQVPPLDNPSFKKKLWYVIVRLFISRYRMTTVNNQTPDIKAPANVFFIPFSVPHTPVKQSYPKRISAESPLKVIVVSKLGEKRKNLIFLLKALLPFFKNGTIQLSIYGFLRDNPVSEKNFKTLTDFIQEHNLKASVQLHPNKSHTEVLNAYARYDLFILPSLNEPAAISPFEAMSSGLPVIVTKQNGTNYIIEEGKNGFVFNPADEQDLQRKIEFFFEHPNSIQACGQYALELINRNYRPNNFSDRLTQLAIN